MPEKLVEIPDMYHAYTGHVLPPTNSEVYNQLKKTEEYSTMNEMKINYKKTKLIVFNPCKLTSGMS